MSPFDVADLKSRGFEGFVAMAQLERNPLIVPSGSGVYVVVRTDEGVPVFLGKSVGGWWKGKDPTVPESRLRSEWVDDAQTLYIGKAASLRERVDLLLGFSRGEAIMHWGGRLLWQLEASATLMLAWRSAKEFVELETALIDEFIAVFGHLPFANLKRGDRTASD